MKSHSFIMSTTDFKRKVKVVIAVNDLSMAGAQRLAIDQMRLLDKNVFDLYLISLMQFRQGRFLLSYSERRKGF